MTQQEIEETGFIFKNKIEHISVYHGMVNAYGMAIGLLFIPNTNWCIIYTLSEVKSVNLFAGEIKNVMDLKTIIRMCHIKKAETITSCANVEYPSTSDDVILKRE